jgi:hypothetical protein
VPAACQLLCICFVTLQLTFRTMTRDFDEPNCNGDYLAAKFRNAIMPARGKLHDQHSRLIKINRVSGSKAFVASGSQGICITFALQCSAVGVVDVLQVGYLQHAVLAASFVFYQ